MEDKFEQREAILNDIANKAKSKNSKQSAYQTELSMWTELFQKTDESTQKAAEGLIQKAAYLHSLCRELEEAINVSGAIKIHPDDKTLQKQVPAVKEYTRTAESYANIVNKLNAIRLKNTEEEEDEGLEKYN